LNIADWKIRYHSIEFSLGSVLTLLVAFENASLKKAF
jgi:hypothetical protein